MKHAFAVAALLTLAPSVLAQTVEDPLYWEVEELGWDLTDRFGCPGIAVARITDGEIAWAVGCGFATVEGEEPVLPETVFNIGSISKTVAAWGVMKLVEEGRIDLDAPIEKYLTRWKLPESEFDEEAVTMRRLLSHTAGLSLHGYPGYLPGEEVPTIEESLRGESNAGELVMIMEPATQWKYSGGGYTIAQLIVEEVSGQSFAEYLKTEVVDPLGMHSSDYRWTETVLAHVATPYDDKQESFGDGPYFAALAAAGFQTSVLDMARFGIASMARGDSKSAQGVLQTKTIAAMQEPQTASPNYGLGYQIQEQDGLRVVGHGGANQGWMAQMSLAPERQDGIVILTNGSNGRSLHGPILAAWRRALAGSE